MQGIVFTGGSQAQLKAFPDPEPGYGEVVVRIRASGMCGSDLHSYRAPTPATDGHRLMIQGHEPCGVVDSVGPGVPPSVVDVGDRVMIHHYWGCGSCVDCRSGWPQLCRVIDPRVPTLNEHGGHASLMKLPAMQTLPLPDELSFKAGAALGCSVGTAWGALVRLGDVAGKNLVVVGLGPVGTSTTMLAAALGARVIAVDIAPRRLDRARRFGAHMVVNSAQEDLAAAVRDLTGGRGAELLVETSGSTAAAGQALESLATWGKACFVGIGADVQFNTRDTLRRQLTLLTSWTMSTIEQLRCARFAVEHDLPLDDLFTHTWSLQQASEAYEWFNGQSDGKGVFEL